MLLSIHIQSMITATLREKCHILSLNGVVNYILEKKPNENGKKGDVWD